MKNSQSREEQSSKFVRTANLGLPGTFNTSGAIWRVL